MTPIQLDDALNDIGNAERFQADWASFLAYVPEIGSWRRWDKFRWKDDNDEAVRCAAFTARQWFDDIAHETDQGRQKKLFAHAQRSCSANSLHNMINIARTLGMTMPQREWDRDPLLLAVENGVIDLRTGKPILPDQRQYISRSAATKFSADATAPNWCSFLDRIMAGNLAMIAFLQRAVGYSLTGDTREQCAFIGWGFGANGKSVFKETLRGLTASSLSSFRNSSCG